MAELSIGEADYLYLEHGVETVRDPDWLAVHGAEFGEWLKNLPTAPPHRGSCRVFYAEGVCTCGAERELA